MELKLRPIALPTFHPFYRGCLLHNSMGAWDRTQDDLIKQNEVAPDPDVIPVPVDDDVAPDEMRMSSLMLHSNSPRTWKLPGHLKKEEGKEV